MKKPKKTKGKTGTKAAAKTPAKTAKKPIAKKSPDEAPDQLLNVVRNGRPPKLVENDKTISQIMGLAIINCTQREAAAALFVSEPTFRKFLSECPRALEAWESGPDYGKASLRRLQFKSAQSGNTRMLTWLGKQWLDQRDKFDGRLSGPGGGPIKHVTAEMTAAEAALAWAETMNGGPG